MVRETRVTFRPSPVPTVFVAVGLIILLNLGAWQLRRNTERKGHLDKVEYRLDAEPVSNAELAAAIKKMDAQAEEIARLKAALHSSGNDNELQLGIAGGKGINAARSLASN